MSESRKGAFLESRHGAREFNTPYGSARVTPSGYVYNVVVDVDHRRQGHGDEIMQQVAADADARGQTLYTQARADLHGFYGKHGFAPVEDPVGPFDLPSMIRKPR